MYAYRDRIENGITTEWSSETALIAQGTKTVDAFIEGTEEEITTSLTTLPRRLSQVLALGETVNHINGCLTKANNALEVINSPEMTAIHDFIVNHCP